MCVCVCVQPQRPEAREPSPGREEQHQDRRLRHGVAPSGGQSAGDQLRVSTRLSGSQHVVHGFVYCVAHIWKVV